MKYIESSPQEVVASDLLVAGYLALVVWRTNRGSRHAIHTFLRVTYLSWFIQKSGWGDAPYSVYSLAVHHLEALAKSMLETGADQMPDDGLAALIRVIEELDQQVAMVGCDMVVTVLRQVDQRIRRVILEDSRDWSS